MISTRTRRQTALKRQSTFNLPVELVEMIVGHCGPHYEHNVLLDLRLTCQDLQAKTRHLFLKTYFSSRSTALAAEVLPKLDEVANVPELANFVKSLYFVDAYEFKHLCNKTFGLAQDDVMTTATKIADTMIPIFRKLPNLKAFYFDHTWRDWYFVEVEDGRRITKGTLNQVLGYQFPAVAIAAKACGIQPEIISGLRIGARPYCEVYPPHLCALLSMDGVFSKLSTLEVQFYGHDGRRPHAKVLDIDIPRMANEFVACLNRIPHLMTLGMSFYSHPGVETFAWFQSIAPSLSAQKLSKIKLEGLNCSWSDLWTLLSRHAKTLRTCELVHFELTAGRGSDCLQRITKRVREELQLERLFFRNLSIDEYEMTFVGMGEPLVDDEFDGEYVELKPLLEMELVGWAEVQLGLSEMFQSTILR